MQPRVLPDRDTHRHSLYSIHVYENTFRTPIHNKVLLDPAAPGAAADRATGHSSHSAGWAGSGARLSWRQGWDKPGFLRAGSAPSIHERWRHLAPVFQQRAGGQWADTCGTGLQKASTPAPAKPTAALLQATAKGSGESRFSRAGTALREVQGLHPPWGSRHLDEVVHGISLGQPATCGRGRRRRSPPCSAAAPASRCCCRSASYGA